jgi:hypothetical protein
MKTRICDMGLVLLVLTGLLLMALPAVSTAWEAEAAHFGRIEHNEDAFLVYDFSSKSHSRTNVDWPMSVLFYGNASIGTVKNFFDHYLSSTGSPMYAYVDDGEKEGGWHWDEDKGRKEGTVLASLPPIYEVEEPCKVVGNDEHYRAYAPEDDSFFTMGRWGYYVVASIHFDHNECSEGLTRWAGDSEQAEHRLSEQARELLGRGSHTVREDYLDWHDGHPTEYVKSATGGIDHYWKSDGQATAIELPVRILK